ncbi:cation:proton antiporter domain-containing protein [Mangrovicoccus algicola]|uniref:Cation:proton antiporter n=1 Tax=Mangrovicoccus algicola TaxID=2771008 RepID=A0A8J6Z2S4_9RHOB|nr:cation:proton antiporter [Mangrovicoccus algicola]MBE3640658.1 cation:proton antiporter [Mangrovicoccus algicola]
MESFLFQATLYLTAAVVAVPLAARLGLGSVLGYLAAGLCIGPVLGLVGNEVGELQHFAEFGVVMMLFLIGLELEPRALWDMRHRLLGLGGLQVAGSAGLIMAGAMALGLDWRPALAVGLAFALSSTAIVLQTLSEKGLMQTAGGRSSFSVLLTQDIAVIPMLALVPLLSPPELTAGGQSPALTGAGGAAELELGGSGGHAEALAAMVDRLPGWGAALLTLGIVAGIILAGLYLIRPIFAYIHKARLRELDTALALLIVMAIAFLMMMVGLSPALGTFLAGVVLASSEFRHELESDIAPFKGLLLGLFFITVGAGIDTGLLLAEPLRVLGLTLAVMALKALVLLGLAWLFDLRGRDRWLFALGLAQAGEFGFVLLAFSLQQSVIPPALGPVLYLVVALSMLLTPLVFMLYEHLGRRLADPGAGGPEADEITEQGPIIIAGIGRFGQVVNRMIQMSGFRAVVLDNDLSTIRLMRRFGFKSFLGDPTRPELLHAAGLARARVLVVAMDDKEACTRIVAYARKERPDLHIVARAYDRVHVYELFRAGADDIVREMFDSSLRAARYVLENMGLSEYEAAEAERAFYKHDRRAMLELAEVWTPGLPVAQNERYVQRARELDREMETEMVTTLGEEIETAEMRRAERS